MGKYLERMGKNFSLFDAPLVYKFSQMSKIEDADLTKVFDDTLVKVAPVNAVVCHISPLGPPFGLQCTSLHMLIVDRPSS